MDWHSLWENLKEYAPIGAIVLFAWGVFQYFHNNELNFRKAYWDRLFQFYVEATSSVATLATSTKKSEWEKARDEFWKLYYGPLCLVESLHVQTIMREIHAIIERTSFDDLNFDDLNNENRQELKDKSLNLAIACRNSIRARWRFSLKKLKPENYKQEH